MDQRLIVGPALLFAPASRPDRVHKAGAIADAVIIDLEDSIDEYERERAVAELADQPINGSVLVRLSHEGGTQRQREIELARQLGALGIIVPKCDSARDLDGLEAMPVIPQIESATGLVAAAEIAAAPGVIALLWGSEDLTTSLGGVSSRRSDGRYRTTLEYARFAILVAAAAARIPALDAVNPMIDREDLLFDEARDAMESGFFATACIHPRQVDIIRRAYMPSAEQIAWAHAVLSALAHDSVAAVDGSMVDAPSRTMAERVLYRASEPRT